jgi:hypothetical protein
MNLRAACALCVGILLCSLGCQRDSFLKYRELYARHSVPSAPRGDAFDPGAGARPVSVRVSLPPPVACGLGASPLLPDPVQPPPCGFVGGPNAYAPPPEVVDEPVIVFAGPAAAFGARARSPDARPPRHHAGERPAAGEANVPAGAPRDFNRPGWERRDPPEGRAGSTGEAAAKVPASAPRDFNRPGWERRDPPEGRVPGRDGPKHGDDRHPHR